MLGKCRVVIGVVLLLAWFALPAVALCPGDVDGDGVIRAVEVVVAVDAALERVPPDLCGGCDGNANGVVTIDEIAALLAYAEQGCPLTPTPTHTATETPVPTLTASATTSPTATTSRTATTTPTVTATPLRAPQIPPRDIYRAFAGMPISLPIGATDPQGGPLHYSSPELPAGGTLADDGVLSWTPTAEQVGPYVVAIDVQDEESPPQLSSTQLGIKVQAVDSCVIPTCKPATGCVYDLPPLSENCCAAGPDPARVPEPAVDCPAAKVLHLGRNSSGFGRLQNCDRLRAFNNGQIGVTIRFNLESRCLDISGPMQIDARLATATRLLFSRSQFVNFTDRRDGYAQRLLLSLPVSGPSPFFDLDHAEAELEVTATDRRGVSATERLRVVLQFDPLADLEEVR